MVENAQTTECLLPRRVAYPWTVEPTVQSKSVFRTSARVLVPVHDMNPVAITDSGASHVILPVNALHDGKSVKQVNLRLAAGEIMAVESQREIFADHITMPLCPWGWLIRKFELTATWTPKILTLSCVNKAGTARGLMECLIKEYTPYLDAEACLTNAA